MNDENLKGHEFTTDQSREEAARNGQKGGIASGEARRRNRTLRELAQIISEKKVNMPMPDGTTEEMTYDAALIQSMYQKAIAKGDTKAATFIAKVLGEIEDKHVVEGNGTVIFLPKEEIDQMDKVLDK
jgi:hypothetical protein